MTCAVGARSFRLPRSQTPQPSALFFRCFPATHGDKANKSADWSGERRRQFGHRWLAVGNSRNHTRKPLDNLLGGSLKHNVHRQNKRSEEDLSLAHALKEKNTTSTHNEANANVCSCSERQWLAVEQVCDHCQNAKRNQLRSIVSVLLVRSAQALTLQGHPQ